MNTNKQNLAVGKPLSSSSSSNTPNNSTSESPIKSLLHRPLTRKQFLKVTAFGLLSLFGFSTIYHFITGKNPSSHIASVDKPNSRKGFGRF